MGYIRYRQARRANKLAAKTASHTAELATAARTSTTAYEETETVTPEEGIRRQAAMGQAKMIEKRLRDGGYRDRHDREYALSVVIALVGSGETIDGAIESVLRWRAEAGELTAISSR